MFSGSYAINPVNGEKVPVYVGNFVVADYGSGMVMAVPAHDHRQRLVPLHRRHGQLPKPGRKRRAQGAAVRGRHVHGGHRHRRQDVRDN